MKKKNRDSDIIRPVYRNMHDEMGEGEWLWTANSEQMSILKSRHDKGSGLKEELELDLNIAAHDPEPYSEVPGAYKRKKRLVPIIDVHCHLTPGDKSRGFSQGHGSLRKYLKQAEFEGICFSIIFPPPSKDYRILNECTMILAKRYPLRFGGCILIHPTRDRGGINILVNRYLRGFPLYGIKVHRHDGNISDEICQTARQYCLPVIYDIMNEVDEIDRLCQSYPEVAFIFPHLGSFKNLWHIQEKVIQRMRRYARAYADTSAIRDAEMLRLAVEELGPQRILFGTDAPFLNPAAELSKLLSIGLTHRELEQILGKNAVRLFRIMDKISLTPASR